ncbi:unnamed protein product [Urochloa humidicola]
MQRDGGVDDGRYGGWHERGTYSIPRFLDNPSTILVAAAAAERRTVLLARSELWTSGSGHMAMGGGAMRKPLVPCATLLAVTSLLHELSYARGRSSLLLPRLGRRLPHHRQLLLEVLKVLDPVAARQAAGHERRRGTAARPPHPSLKAYGTTDPPLASCYAFILSSSASYFKKHISCSMQPSNLSNDYIAFQMERIRKAVV